MTFVILAFAIWRITSLLTNPGDAGPWGIMHKVRHFLGMEYDEWSSLTGNNEFTRMLSCTWCSSVWFGWIAAFLFRGHWDVHWLIVGLALSGAVILIDTITRQH